MDTEGRRRSDNFEDRGQGAGGGRAGMALPIQALFGLVRILGIKGTVVVATVLGVGYFLLPPGIKHQLLGGGGGPANGGAGATSVCKASPNSAKACDFSRVILASTEDVWTATFRRDELPNYGRAQVQYSDPTLVVFAVSVDTGCGTATSALGPFYCPRDRRLYIDPGFYQVMAQRLRAPGDFAQAYVIAHEVGHHVQNLIGATSVRPRGETANQLSVRVELQADCFAGVWGHTARASLAIDDLDLKEAVNAAHAIGDDALGNTNAADQTHGTSVQRMRWFRRGFETGDARKCDTFSAARPREL
jgi:predicted metalloprotease